MEAKLEKIHLQPDRERLTIWLTSIDMHRLKTGKMLDMPFPNLDLNVHFVLEEME